MINQIPKNWQKVKLGEAVNKVFSGGTPNTRRSDYWDGDFKWLSSGETRQQFVYDTDRKITEQGVNNSSTRLAKKGDVVIASAGQGNTRGQVSYLKVDTYINQSIISVHSKESEIDSLWLFYNLLSRYPELRAISESTSIRGSLTIPLIKNLDIYKPTLDKQKRIASILSTFDDKIELNSKITQTLEEMARAIFKEWFVNFKFPGHEKVKFADSELGKIPKKWEVKAIHELVNRVPMGKRYDSNNVKGKGAIPVLDQGKSGIIGYHDGKPDVEASEDNPVIVFANHTCYQNLTMYPFSAIQNVIPFYPSENNNRSIYWLYLATFGLVKFNDYKGHWPEFTLKRVSLPPENLCERFGQTIKPMFISKYNIEKENQKLAAMRDLLLPKLMRGEIRV